MMAGRCDDYGDGCRDYTVVVLVVYEEVISMEDFKLRECYSAAGQYNNVPYRPYVYVNLNTKCTNMTYVKGKRLEEPGIVSEKCFMSEALGVLSKRILISFWW